MSVSDRDYMKDNGERERRVSEWEDGEPRTASRRMSRAGQIVLAIVVAVILLLALGVIRLPF